MSETICAIGSSSETTLPRAERDWRSIIGMGAAAVAMVALALLQLLAWDDQSRLQLNFQQAEAPSAHLGETLREGITTLGVALFRFQLSGNESERDLFRVESRRLAGLLSESKSLLPSDVEREIAGHIEESFRNYLSAADEIEPLRGIRRGTAETLASTVEEQLAPVMEQVERLATLQKERRTALLAQSTQTLKSLGRSRYLSVVSLGLLFASVFLLMQSAVLVPRKKRQDEIQSATARHEKLASLGVLATGVAHEIRNPLTAIKFRLFSLKKTFGAGLAENEDYQTIRKEIDRLETIVKSFLQFARPPDPQIGSVSASELLDHVRQLLEPEMAKRHIQIAVDAGEPIQFLGDRQQLEQVLINLAQNAADSMTDGGTVSLRARGGAMALADRPEPVVLLDVIDTGPGIPMEIQKRLFDPFFSTKEGGTGLGLAIAARIVEKNGGRMQFSTRKDQGTTFTVVLPLENRNADHTDSPDRR